MFDVVMFGVVQQQVSVVVCLILVQQFVEYFDVGYGGFLYWMDVDDFDFVVNFDYVVFDMIGYYGVVV